MRFIRTTSTARLLALVFGVACLAGATAAIALAATSQGGSKPSPKPLALAVHDALSAPQVPGVSARIKFTNHLIDSTAVAGCHAARERRERAAVGQRGRPRAARAPVDERRRPGGVRPRPLPRLRRLLEHRLPGNAAAAAGSRSAQGQRAAVARADPAGAEPRGRYAGISGAIPTTAAGRPAYEVRITPRHGGQVSGAAAGVGRDPRRAAAGGGLRAWRQLAGAGAHAPRASPTARCPPRCSPSRRRRARTWWMSRRRPEAAAARASRSSRAARRRRALPFTLSAPPRLAGKRRQEVKLLGHDGALVTYGQGLDGIAVIERKADAGSPEPLGGLRLPTVSIAARQRPGASHGARHRGALHARRRELHGARLPAPATVPAAAARVATWRARARRGPRAVEALRRPRSRSTTST